MQRSVTASRLALALSVFLGLSACGLTGRVGTPPGAPAGAHRGGVLRVGITAPGGIDPLNAYEPVGKLISSTLCDSIVSLDPVTGQVREALALGWVNADGVSMTIKLRHGVTFSNGAELTERDVNSSLQQLVAPANGAYPAALARQFAPLPSSGQADLLADPTKANDVAASVNKYDFQLVVGANGGALRTLAEPALAPVSHAQQDQSPNSVAADPICVGPYVLSKPYKSGDTQIRLLRSKHYYAQNVGYTSGGVGYADEIDFTVYPTAAAALVGYQRGQVDVVEVPSTAVAGVKDTGSLVYGPATAEEYLGLPGGTTGPFSDANLRLALSEAIDRTKLVADVFGPAAQVATGFEPPALAISTGPSLEGKRTTAAPLTSCGAQTPAVPDIASAQAHLAAARHAATAPITGFTLEVNDDAPYPAMARELAAQWKANLGLAVKVDPKPWSSYLATATSSAGFSGPFRIRWSTDSTAPATTYNNEQSYLASLFSPTDDTTGNWARFTDRGFDFGLAEEAASITDVAQRGLAFGKLTAILCRQLPILPLVFERPAFLVRSTTLGSARPVPVGRDGVLLLRELYLR